MKKYIVLLFLVLSMVASGQQIETIFLLKTHHFSTGSDTIVSVYKEDKKIFMKKTINQKDVLYGQLTKNELLKIEKIFFDFYSQHEKQKKEKMKCQHLTFLLFFKQDKKPQKIMGCGDSNTLFQNFHSNLSYVLYKLKRK